MKMSPISWVAFILTIIGGLNWGLVGISASYNVVDGIFGAGSVVSRIIYILVGLSAIYLLVSGLMKNSKSAAAPQM